MTGSTDRAAAGAARQAQGGAPDEEARSPDAHGRLPDFYIVGQRKSGTTALYEMLRGHPDIFMPAVKEPRFFAEDLRPPTSIPYEATLAGYMALFAPARADQLAGEATPMYLSSRVAARAIAAARPDARIIAIFREPASFLRSLHLQHLQAHIETETDLRRAIELEDARRQGRQLPRGRTRAQALLYSEHVRYVEQLRRFHAAFPREQVLVLIYEDFRADNEATVRRVLRFLGVDDAVALAPVTANPAVRVRSVRLNHLLRTLSTGRGAFGRTLGNSIKAVTPRTARRRALATLRGRLVYGRPAPPDERLMAELRDRFRGEAQALGEYIGRDLISLWGYDRPG